MAGLPESDPKTTQTDRRAGALVTEDPGADSSVAQETGRVSYLDVSTDELSVGARDDPRAPTRAALKETRTFAQGDSASPAVPRPPERDWPTIAGYEILGVLGRGGMGRVYKARHINLQRLVALKVVLAGEDAEAEQVARFREEAK